MPHPFAIEQLLCPVCNPWAEHAGLLLGVLGIGVFAGMFAMALLRFASEEARLERQRDAAHAAEQERLATLRAQGRELASPGVRDVFDHALDGRPLIDKPAPGRRRP